jgi:hypothetical protein
VPCPFAPSLEVLRAHQGNACEHRAVFICVCTLRICKRYPHSLIHVASLPCGTKYFKPFLTSSRLSLAPHVSSRWHRAYAQLLVPCLPTAAAAEERFAHLNNKHPCHDVSKYRGNHVPTHALFSNGGRVSCDEALLREREVSTSESRCSWTPW